MTDPKRASILIVEDERIVAKDLQQTLVALGYDAFAIASSAEEAIARASERCPDLVLMDIRIKGDRDGIKTAMLLNERFSVPVVYLTAHADDATLSRAKETHPHGYPLKPVRSAELRSAIEVSLFRHEMEKRLRERERWFSTTLRSIADGVIAVDLAGRITFVNPAAEALLGATGAAVMGRPAKDVLRLVDDRFVALSETPLEAVLRDRLPSELSEASLLNLTTGLHRLISDSAAPVTDDGHPLGAVMVFRDVSEQKAMRRQLELSDRLASLGTMAAGVAHEINNPLAVVAANADFIASELTLHREGLAGDADVERRRVGEILDALGDLGSAARRIRRIVADLRVFARPPVEQVAGIADLVRCAEWAVRTTAREFRARARLVTTLGPVPPVNADEMRLGQVVINLLVNAAHAIEPGRASENEVRISTATDGQGRAVIEVYDSGCGIPPAILGRIFEPFFTTKVEGMGTGLGLSICHGIVKSVGGTIAVESEVGKGTTFRVVLPPAVQEEQAASTERAAPFVAGRARVLVVDDEEMILRVVKRLLRGHDVIAVTSAKEGLAHIDRGEYFDVIFSDLMMPDVTGVEFYATLLGRSPELARRVVFITGGATTAAGEDFLRSVPNQRIEKPFEGRSLGEAVEAAVALRSREGA